jgi:hypothetical protein
VSDRLEKNRRECGRAICGNDSKFPENYFEQQQQKTALAMEEGKRLVVVVGVIGDVKPEISRQFC